MLVSMQIDENIWFQENKIGDAILTVIWSSSGRMLQINLFFLMFSDNCNDINKCNTIKID